MHEGYGGSWQTDDIALLRLAAEVELDWHINIIPLAEENAGSFAGWKAKASGWGRLGLNGPWPYTLQEVHVTVFGNSFARKFCWFSVKHICAGVPEGGRSTCLGDSGGPLTLKQNGRYQLIGVILGGRNLIWPRDYYMRVTEYRDWIDETLERRTYY